MPTPTPVWIVLLPVISVIVTLVVTLTANHFKDRAQRVHDLEVLKMKGEREDRMAVTPNRVDAYGAFCDGLVEVSHASPEELPALLVDLEKKLLRLQIASSTEVGDRAQKYFDALVPPSTPSTNPALAARAAFVAEMRGEMKWSRRGSAAPSKEVEPKK